MIDHTLEAKNTMFLQEARKIWPSITPGSFKMIWGIDFGLIATPEPRKSYQYERLIEVLDTSYLDHGNGD